MQHKVISLDDGQYKAMCPNDGTWGLISEEQYQGKAECTCTHPKCGHKWTHNYEQEAAPAKAAPEPDRF